MATYNKETGAVITGLDEVFQGIDTIFGTLFGTRVMRRKFGAVLPRMVDKSLSQITLIEWFAAIADGLKQEPRFRLIRSGLSKDSNVGQGGATFDISGIWYPRGHLGDFSEAISITRTVAI